MTAMTDEQIIDLWSPRLGEGIQRPVLGKNKIIAFGRACIAAERARADALERQLTQMDAQACNFSDRADALEAALQSLVSWFSRSGDGSMSGLSDAAYMEAVRQWLATGNELADAGRELLKPKGAA